VNTESGKRKSSKKATDKPDGRKGRAGRKSTYTTQIAMEVCRRVAEGEWLEQIAGTQGAPGKSALYEWLLKHKEFADAYARAREIRADAMARELIEIADDGRNDWMAREDPDNPGYTFNGEHVQRSKLRSDNRKWLMARLSPRQYGERVQVANDPDNPMPAPTTNVSIDYAALRERLKGKPGAPDNND